MSKEAFAMQVSQMKQGLSLEVSALEKYSYALAHAGILPIRGITVNNATGGEVEHAEIRITSELGYFAETAYAVEALKEGTNGPLTPEIRVDIRKLMGLIEAIDDRFTVTLSWQGEEIARKECAVKVLPMFTWWNDSAYPGLLAAFVQPNHPVVKQVMRSAALLLEVRGQKTSLCGYQLLDQLPGHVTEQVSAIYGAMADLELNYISAPPTFISGQPIRMPDEMAQYKHGTCMDMSLLFAACLEAAGLHAVLLLKHGHIYCGWWKRGSEAETMAEKQADAVKKWLDEDKVDFVECTAMCVPAAAFEAARTEAVMATRALHAGEDPDAFEALFDLRQCRRRGFTPLPVAGVSEGEEEATVSFAVPAAKEAEEPAPAADPRTLAEQKVALWETRLLDLSARNRLLNMRPSAVLPLASASVGHLEDALSDGKAFRVLPLNEELKQAQVIPAEDPAGKDSFKAAYYYELCAEKGSLYELTGWDGYDGEKITDATGKIRDYLTAEIDKKRLYAYMNDGPLNTFLTHLYRDAQTAEQETGVSSLYLGVGTLRWMEKPGEAPHYAPLILFPAQIRRRRAGQGYELSLRDEEVHFNTTLLEFLRQTFNLSLGAVEPLPKDEKGVDVDKVLAAVRRAVSDNKNGWQVFDTVSLGNFRFGSFALWNDIHTAGEKLNGSPMVRSLLQGHLDLGEEPDTDAGELILPISVDDTQLSAVKMAAEGKSFVLYGPPGTGKSQTITAMIANLLAQGKRVLFVAEKMAALSVVEKRLDALGIGDFCLEIHSEKAGKAHVLSQLEKAMEHSPAEAKENRFGLSAEALESRKAELDRYRVRLHAKLPCGLSMRELIARYTAVENASRAVRLKAADAVNFTEEAILAADPLLRRLTDLGEPVRGALNGPMKDVNLSGYTFSTGARLEELLPEYEDALKRLAPFAQMAGLYPAGSVSAMTALSAKMKALEARDRAADDRLLGPARQEAQAFYDARAALTNERAALCTVWKPSFLDGDPAALKNELAEAEKKLFLVRKKAVAEVMEKIKAQCEFPVPEEQLLPRLDEAVTFAAHRAELNAKNNALSPDTKTLVSVYPGPSALQDAVRDAEAAARDRLSVPNLDAMTRDAFTRAADDCAALAAEVNALLCREGCGTCADELALTGFLCGNTSALKDWGAYRAVRLEAEEAGLAPAIEAYEKGLPAEDLLPAWHRALCSALIADAFGRDEVLNRFSGNDFDSRVKEFRRLDEELLALAKDEVFRRVVSRLPEAAESAEISTQRTILRKEIGKNRKNTSLRQLFAQVPDVLPRLAPCMLMSPDTVAEILPCENGYFDTVIFDEASQMPTAEAVSALIRAKSAVVVGDPMQMPPTAFFTGDGPEVDDVLLDDQNSILDDMIALEPHETRLRWHYRSTHESLIAFSNRYFYENSMFTFPSVNDRERRVTAVAVNGLYSQNTNPDEAVAIVADVVRRCRDPKRRGRSVGIVTFNQRQRDLIDDLLQRRMMKDPELEAWASRAEEPLFIKNLENVQGDERDDILFSTTFGHDEKGRFIANFGPINNVGGERRLNVAFSRAKVSMTVYTSMRPEEIRVTETSSQGLKCLRAFLEYAMAITDIRTDGRKEQGGDGLRAGIRDALKGAGYACDENIGRSDFKIDLAVVDPDAPQSYLLGILLDGDTYRDTANVRDREVSQASVLERLGWSLRRVWSVDWLGDKARELRRLTDALAELRAAGTPAEETAPVPEDAELEASIRADLAELRRRKKKEEEAQPEEAAAEEE